MDPSRPAFWDQRYRTHRMPWDMRGTPRALADYLKRAKAPGSALVPGCGSAYEVRTFHEFGWDVLALDFSPAAVDRARAVLGPLGEAVSLGDFFADPLGGPFDVIYERTFLCSLPPARWRNYALRMADLLRPKGRLVGVFFYGAESDPPPFPLSPAEADATLGPWFRLVEDHAIPPADSLPRFAGTERWQVWRKK